MLFSRFQTAVPTISHLTYDRGCRDDRCNTIGRVCTVSTNGELQSIQATYDGKDNLKWPQLVRTVLKGKAKKPGDSWFEAWDEEDSMIMSQL